MFLSPLYKKPDKKFFFFSIDHYCI